MLTAAFATFVTTAALTPMLAAWARRRRYLDIPNARSSHLVATPRIGGAALVLGVLVGVGVLHVVGGGLGARALIVVGGAVLVAVLGLVDDFRQLPALVRLPVQLLIAALVVGIAGPLPWPWLHDGGAVANVVTVLWIVAVTNAYNFMDGIDGIAGGQALVAGIAWTIVGLSLASSDASALGLVLAAAACGFLPYNWQPARVFMGDAGSGFLGFAFAALPLLVPAGQGLAIWAAVIVLWAFLFDTGSTLIRRALRGENILTAHKSHLYQRLVQTGRSHAYVSLLYSGLGMLGAAGAVWLTRNQDGSVAPVLLGLATAAALLWRIVAGREAAARAAASTVRR